MSSTANKPSHNPAMAANQASSTMLADGPRPLTEHELAIAATGIQTLTASAIAVPTMSPPGTPGAIVAIDGAVTWLTGKKVVAMWANRAARNAYAYLDGVGWKRLADTSDSAHTSLTMLASAARQTGSGISVRDDGDGRIREIYVW
jgi:hypothetical protein